MAHSGGQMGHPGAQMAHHTQQSAYHRPMNTPMRTVGPMRPGQDPRFAPTGSASKQPQHNFTSVAVASAQKKPPSSGGKENGSPSTLRRGPCNCKKSKCLKLYCECFSMELYCEGCNCNDCNNIPEFESIRGKAIKDTRSKNPNAFKPRISARPAAGPTPQSGHNMGCKCKKSECLKKYCEVRL
jgi:hypothetical protein